MAKAECSQCGRKIGQLFAEIFQCTGCGYMYCSNCVNKMKGKEKCPRCGNKVRWVR